MSQAQNPPARATSAAPPANSSKPRTRAAALAQNPTTLNSSTSDTHNPSSEQNRPLDNTNKQGPDPAPTLPQIDIDDITSRIIQSRPPVTPSAIAIPKPPFNKEISSSTNPLPAPIPTISKPRKRPNVIDSPAEPASATKKRKTDKGKGRQIDNPPSNVELEEADVAHQLIRTIPGIPLAAVPQHRYRLPPVAVTSSQSNEYIHHSTSNAPFNYHKAPDPIPSFSQITRRVSFSNQQPSAPFSDTNNFAHAISNLPTGHLADHEQYRPTANLPRRIDLTTPIRPSPRYNQPPTRNSSRRYSQHRSSSPILEEVEDEDMDAGRNFGGNEEDDDDDEMVIMPKSQMLEILRAHTEEQFREKGEQISFDKSIHIQPLLSIQFISLLSNSHSFSFIFNPI